VCVDCCEEVLAEARRQRRAEQDNPFSPASIAGILRGVRVEKHAEPGELDTELLRDLLALAHPDLHSPARKELATRARLIPIGELERWASEAAESPLDGKPRRR
jgi:hypothetical protein